MLRVMNLADNIGAVFYKSQCTLKQLHAYQQCVLVWLSVEEKIQYLFVLVNHFLKIPIMCEFKMIALINYETGSCLRKWTGHTKEVTKVWFCGLN